uniref:Hippocampus abundant transcript 1 protein n=1 Tax=Anthurium amnicola TaxID=1678845 RepID=A0A1D1XDC4_9ARAE
MKDLAGLGHLFVCVFLYHFSAFMVLPAITDITMAALCPGRDQCSLAIYLSGFQQAITGMGTLMVTPLVGNLSDRYGRKALLTLPMSVAVIPLAILAYSRTATFFYVYYAVKIAAGVFCEGSMQCLPIAYVADQVGERRRASAIGMLSGVSMAGFVSGTLTSRFLSTNLTFRVSASVAVSAALYMRLFLVESNKAGDAITEGDASRPILAAKPSSTDAEGAPRLLFCNKGGSVGDMIRLLRSSVTFSRAAILAFLSSLGDGGLHSALLYYLKARFHFNKDQFADLLLIAGAAGAISQLLLMPMLVPAVGEERLLSIGLLASCIHIFLYSIAWASWVPYFASMFVVMSIFSQPCIRSIVSKKVGSNEQGMAQGCISGIHSFANVLSPLAFTPLTALFLSENAPFYFPGFSLMCIGFVSMAAFIQSIIMTRPETQVCSHKFSNNVQH